MPDKGEHLCSTCVRNRVCYIRKATHDATDKLKQCFQRSGQLIIKGKAEYDVIRCEEYREDKEKTDGDGDDKAEAQGEGSKSSL